MAYSTTSLKTTAKFAGLCYLVNVVTSAYGMVYVSSKINMAGAAGDIIRNIIDNEFLFRSGILSRLLSSVPWLLLALTLYRLLRQVNSHMAKLMFACMVLTTPIGVVAEGFNICGLMIAKGELLNSATMEQRAGYALLFLNIYKNIISVSQIFWGLWLLPFGLLICKSLFIPRFLGGLLLLGGAGYIFEWTIFILSPAYKSSISSYTMLFGSGGEISVMLWLLIKGVKKIRLNIASF